MRKKKVSKSFRSTKPTFLTTTRKQEELIGSLLLLLGVLVMIALFTYDQEETPRNINVRAIKNGLGIAGVYVSHYLIRWTIGYPIFFLPFLIIAWGVNRLLGKSTVTLWRGTMLAAVYSSFISVSFALHDALSTAGTSPLYKFSGRMGGIGAEFLMYLFGQYGAVVVVIGLLMFTVLLSTTVSVSQLYTIIVSLLARFFFKISSLWSRFVADVQHRARHQGLAIKRAGGSFGRRETIVNRPAVSPPTADRAIPSRRPAPQPVQQNMMEDGMPPGTATIAPDTAQRSPAERRAAAQMDFGFPPPRHKEDRTGPDLPTTPMPLEELPPYEFPSLDLLQMPLEDGVQLSEEELRNNAHLLEETLSDFGVNAHVVEVHPGPVITRYELELAPGTKVSRVTALSDDLALAMRAKRIRIVAPIPGKAAVGVEIPNPDPSIVYLRDILATDAFRDADAPLTIGLGKTISGTPYIADLAAMPHLLIAGSTGSGKSVCLNTVIASFLFRTKPSEVQLVLIDPKRLELSTYSKLHRHHLTYVEGSKDRVATTAKSATYVLKSIEQVMEQRYELLAGVGVRNIQEYNQRVEAMQVTTEEGEPAQKLHYIVLIVDELADLMLTSQASKEVEEPIARLTQMSRAVGIHLILATQRPSVDVITGVIKANFPARIAFQVASKIDSRTILDMNGAEKLLGRGDMLFLPPGSPEPIRIHSAYITLPEIENLIGAVSHQAPVKKKLLPAFVDEGETERYGYDTGKRDVLFDEALKLVVRHQQGSVSLIQRRLKVGYSRAARLIDELEDAGIVGPFEGSKARDVLITPEELESWDFDDDEEEV